MMPARHAKPLKCSVTAMRSDRNAVGKVSGSCPIPALEL
jgi:hypothetical protein